MVRVKRRVLWTLLALITISALWAMKIEITYEHNIRHIPTDFRIRFQRPTYRWKA